MNNKVLEAIYTRRSIREFSEQSVTLKNLREIIKAGTWAPSGLNNQPWRFVTISDNGIRLKIAEKTRYSHIIKGAPALIAVFLDKDDMDNDVKDHQAAGACIQNMLLAIEALDLGAVWLGEILNQKEEVNRILDLVERFDLMAVLAIGHPAHHDQTSNRKDVNDVLLKEITEDN